MDDGDLLFVFDQVSVAPEGPEGPRILDGVDAAISAIGITVLAGPSGAGKSTLLRLCNRLEVATKGTVRYRGDDVAGLDPLALRRRVGMVFQRPVLFAGTVRDNLRVADPHSDDERFGSALEEAGLDRSFLDRQGDDLSGGEAQRACLARTLVTEPDVLLMDEPTSSLDPSATRRLETSTRRLAATGVAVVWVTHELDQVRRLADHTLVLVDGRVAGATEAAAFLAGDDPDLEADWR